ncbi:MAG TPA: signal peptide peptidase SppA [Gemmataceae bacterium]|nr:signal peptide peptidase SppA [Gemmataceae bacterium]
MSIRRFTPLALIALIALTPMTARLRAADDSTPAVAHIKLTGDLDEAPVAADSLLGGSSENFKSKLDRIKKAAKDDNVKALYLEIDDLGVGWGKMDELARAIAEFRKTGKKVFAYIEGGEAKDYLLATSCDEICEPESGWLMLIGVRAEVGFYKNLLDKIGVKADMLRMGDAKSAVEPYIQDHMSDASRKQLEGVLNDYYENSMVGRVVQNRPAKHFTAEQVKKIIDAGPYTANAAKEKGLIDRVAYKQDFEDSFKKTLKLDKADIARNYGSAKSDELDLSSPFAIFKLLAPSKGTESSDKPKIAVIYATGVITSGKSSGGSLFGEATCGSTTMIEAIKQAEDDDTVKAIVLRVDSPGGSALASDLMWSELTRCKKPVIASMSDTAASGGYYICMGAKKIYAEPGTLTGSIGVFGGKMALGGTYEKLGINTEVITRGANANIFSTTFPFSESEKEAMTALIHETYDQFLNKAIAGRNGAGVKMTRKDLEPIAGGRIWTGRQAKGLGLVDELGDLNDAVAASKKAAGLPEDKEMELLILPKPRSFLDALLDAKSDALVPRMAMQELLREAPELAPKLRAVEGLLRMRGEPVWLMDPCRIEVR